MGVDAMRLADLRGMFSVVSQEALLFDETLRENIVLGQDVSEVALQAALDAAHVSDFLPRLEHGLETRVGAARLCPVGRPAPARRHRPRASARHADPAAGRGDERARRGKSEAVVQEALEKLSRGRTTLVIAHRLSTVRSADKIVVMDLGRVVDEGTHDELVARGGPYRDLYRLQFADT